ncbi:MAG: histidine kinase [Pyrinomonadaceae bacterium]
MKRRSWIVWVAIFAGWMLVGLSFSVNDYLFVDSLRQYYQETPDLRSLLYWDLAYWPTWALLAPLIFWLARRFPLDREKWPRNLVLHIVLGLVLIVPQRAVYLSIAWTFQNLGGEHIPLVNLYRKFLLYNLPTGLMSYGVILLGGFLLNFYDEYQQEKLRSTRLRAELNQAQLQALKMQLQPHFLFNTFNSISAMLHEDANAADEMLAQLGDFLRLTLDNSGEQMVTLEAELEFLRQYLSIEQIRLQDRLRVDYDIDPQALTAAVPNLVLQPIIENVIKHGVGQSYGPVRVSVSAQIKGDRLRLSVSDDGPGLPQNGQAGADGFGLNNTRARLRSAFDDDFHFGLSLNLSGGTAAVMDLPFIQHETRAAEATS